jgi:hypothetical protein
MCSSVIDEGNEEKTTTDEKIVDSCAFSVDKTASAAIYESCITKFSTEDGETTITRSGSFENETNHCDSVETAEGGTICYCDDTNNCNDEAVKFPTEHDCYDCESSDFFDNGCGEELDVKSEWVIKVKGCSACGKRVVYEEDHIVEYERMCVRSVNPDEGCRETEEYEMCTCEGDFCNSARGLTPLTSTVCLLLLSIFASSF